MVREPRPPRRQCTATAKRTGVQCRRWAVAGYDVCQVHGAGSPKQGRPGGRPVVTGRYSKHLPADLRARYEAGKADPDLRALDDEIALVYARLTQCLERLGTGESASAWAELRGVHARLAEAIAASSPQGLREGMADFLRAIDTAEAGEATWRAVLELVERRRRLAESESRIEVMGEQAVSAREVAAAFALLMDVVTRHVPDPAVRAAIGRDVRGLIDLPVQ